MNTRRLIHSGLRIAMLILTACTAPLTHTQPTMKEITLQLPWSHQAQFAGFYVADQSGGYAAEGLSVQLIEGGPQIDPLTSVLEGSAQFGITNAERLIVAAAEGKLLRAIATIYRRSPRVYMALSGSGITQPRDFAGKTIQIAAGGLPVLYSVTKHVGLSPDQYTIVETSADLTPFYNGEVDVRAGFVVNEVITAQAAGYELNLIYPDDYGVHFYADTIFGTEDFIEKNPDLTLRFLRTTLEGWTYAVENPAQAASLLQKYKPDADLELETEKMIASIPLINTGEDYIGWMKPQIWADIESTLRKQEIVSTPLDVTQVYTLHFLEAIYDN